MLVCADRRISTGSTQSFFSISRMRRFGGDRQREQHQVDAGAARELDDVVDLAELRAAGAGVHRAVVVAIVEHAEDVDVEILGLRVQRLDQLFAVVVGADDDGAAVETALAAPAAHHRAQDQAAGDQKARPTKKNAESHTREMESPSLAKNDAPMNSRNTNDQDEIIRVICRNWPRKTCTS